MKMFSIKNLKNVRIIICLNVNCDSITEYLNINQKKYIYDFMKFEKISLFYQIILYIKTCFFFY